MASRRIFVCCLNPQTTTDTLRGFLSLFGWVLQCKVDHKPNASYAFVSFYDTYAVPVLLGFGKLYFEGRMIRFEPHLYRYQLKKRKERRVVDHNRNQSSPIAGHPTPSLLYNIVTTGYHGFNTVETYYNNGQGWVQGLETYIAHY